MKTMGESNTMVKLFEIETQTNKHNMAKCVCYDDRIVLSTHHTKLYPGKWTPVSVRNPRRPQRLDS